MPFDHHKIEPKWRKFWEKEKLYRAIDFAKKPKRYILIEFPYPSGERLHVGHARSYCCLDAVARLQRMRGYNVLFPIGWDAFGLPAENYAIRTGIHPSITTKENVANAKKQVQSWGLSFDWDREINTTDPDYYRWTQWIFLQFFKKGLAYKAEVSVNWCPSCKINLADEEVVARSTSLRATLSSAEGVAGSGRPNAALDLASPSGGRCERCGTPVTRRLQSQWMLKITAYADRLIDDLEKVDYRADIKAQQINWIGRSAGTQIKFKILNSKFEIPVFTTRADTLFGATFLVLSPEKAREYLDLVTSDKRQEVEGYIEQSLRKSELQRQEEMKEKTGVFTGVYAQHPFWRDLPAGRQELPVWVADFVLSGYGTGAVMAVPAHDQRDFEFAKKYGLPVKIVVKPANAASSTRRVEEETRRVSEVFEGEGVLVKSAQFDGLQSKEAIDKITQFLVAKELGQKSIDYKLRDWVFSRQHYWGEPIPIVFCRKCWEVKSKESNETPEALTAEGRSKMREGLDFVKIDGKEHAIVPVSEEDLPVKLPYVENYKPTETGESPLAVVDKWVNVRCPICNSQARRETDTMPNWAGSSWYYLAYAFWRKLGDQKVKIKKQRFESVFEKYRKKLDYWLPVDWYNGGMEHTTLHLLYSRFWYKLLYDLKLVPGSEPYAKRTSHGVVLGPDGQKMSKSRENVINPDEVVAEFGADAFRMYEAFMGPFEQMIAWDPKGVLGVRRFLDKVWRTHQQVLANSEQQTANSSKGRLAVSRTRSEIAISAGDMARQRLTPASRDTPLAVRRKLHQLIKKVEEDTMALKFNTAVAAMMGFINQMSDIRYQISGEDWGMFLRVLAPYAPHLTEELFYQLDPKPYTLDPKFSVHLQPWPKYDPEIIVEETVTIIVQVDGRLRGKLELPVGEKEAEIAKLAREIPSVKHHLDGRSSRGGSAFGGKLAKTVFIPDNLINFVTKDAI